MIAMYSRQILALYYQSFCVQSVQFNVLVLNHRISLVLHGIVKI